VEVQVRDQAPSTEWLVLDECLGGFQLNLSLIHHVPLSGTSGELLPEVNVQVMYANVTYPSLQRKYSFESTYLLIRTCV